MKGPALLAARLEAWTPRSSPFSPTPALSSPPPSPSVFRSPFNAYRRSNPSASRSVPWEDAAPSTRAAAARPPLRATAAPRTAAAAAAAADATPWTELAVRADELRQSHRSLQAVCEGLRAELDAPSGAMVERRARRAAAPLQSASVSTAHVDRARLAPMYEVTVRGPLESDYSYKAISA